MNIQDHIVKKLDYFYRTRKIPHIIFYGPTHGAKDMIVSQFINRIYDENRINIKNNVLFVSCSGKGIKFIRDEIKTFAKMHIQYQEGKDDPGTFKTVILLNADFLTDDAQSALRRSIELFSYNTRFFLLVEDRSRLLKPILSRFCEIYIPPTPVVLVSEKKSQRVAEIAADVASLTDLSNNRDIINMASQWYEMGYSSYDFMQYVESVKEEEDKKERCIHVLFLFHKLKTEFRCEKLFLWFLLDFYLFRSYDDLHRLKEAFSSCVKECHLIA